MKQCLIALAAAAMLGGCWPPSDILGPQTPPALLPAEVRLHPFTGTRDFSKGGGISGIEARIEMIDHFGDATKAFGAFRFDVYRYRPHQANPKGGRFAQWSVDLTDPQVNLQHWDNLSRTYRFHLRWGRPLPVGEKFILRVVFSPIDGARLFDEQQMLSGQ